MPKNDEFINTLYTEYFFRLCEYCSALLNGDDAAALDCVHAVFDDARKSAAKLERHPNIIGWLKVAAHNRVKRALRSRGVRLAREFYIDSDSERYVDSLQYTQSFEEQLSENVMESDIASLKDEVLACLNVDERRLYDLRFKEGLTYKSLAKALDKPESSVRLAVIRVELKLRQKASETAQKIYFDN